MQLKEYIKQVMDEIPYVATVNFEVRVKYQKGELKIVSSDAYYAPCMFLRFQIKREKYNEATKAGE